MAQQSVFSLFKIKIKNAGVFERCTGKFPKKYPQNFSYKQADKGPSGQDADRDSERERERQKKQNSSKKIIHSSLNVTPLESKSPERHWDCEGNHRPPGGSQPS